MKVYLNYVSLDYNFAVQIAQYLEAKRDLFNVDSPESARNWAEIVERIAESDLLIYFISPEAIEDHFWHDQLNEALKREIPVIGLLIRQIDAILPSVGERQPIDMTGGVYSRHLQELDTLLDDYLNGGILSSLNRCLIAAITILAILLITVFLAFFQEDGEIDPLDQTLTSAALRPTDTSTSTATFTIASSSTNTSTNTASPTSTATFTSTLSPTSTETFTRTPSRIPVRTRSTATAASRLTEINHSPTARATRIFTSTNILTATVTASKTGTPTNTMSATATLTSSATLTRTLGSTPTFTSLPTITRSPASIMTLTIDPNSVLCPGAPFSQLVVGDQAVVIHVSGVSLRSQPDTTSELIEYLTIGTDLMILDGPVCEEGFRWWRVTTNDELEGWVAEGDLINYYIVPQGEV